MTPRRQLLLDTAMAVAFGAAMLVEVALYRDTGPWPSAYAVGAVVLAVSPLFWRRRHPEIALLASLASIFVLCLLTGIYRTIPATSVVCGYTIAAQSGRRRAIPAGIVSAVAVVAMIGLLSPHGLWSWETPKNLALVALPLGLGVAEHERRRAGEEQTRSQLGEQRLLIARDVHDVVAHAMVAINVQAGVGAHLLDRDPEQARRNLIDIKRTSGEALTDLRATLGVLRDVDDTAMTPTTRDLERRDLTALGVGFEAAGLDVTFELEPDEPVGTTTYRLVTEALTNVLRHSGSERAVVRVRRAAGLVTVEVTDDGCGSRTPAHAAAPGSGHGLQGMRERVAAVGGTVEAGPEDAGWRVRASLPVEVS